MNLVNASEFIDDCMVVKPANAANVGQSVTSKARDGIHARHHDR